MGRAYESDPRGINPLSELDLRLKLNTARLFWLMGSSTLLRVRLSATEVAARARIAELTDLDVLGVSVAPDFRLRYKAAECKSSKVGAKELFWLRGVLDFFGADDGYLVIHYKNIRRQALRELAERLRLGILTSDDFETLLAAHGEDKSHHDQILFERSTIAAGDELLATLDKRLTRLADYTLRVFWQQPLHRNLQLAVAYLDDAKDALDSRQRSHLLLFAEVVYRYCLSLFGASEAIVKRGAPNVAELLQAHLHGGERGLRDANRRLQAVKEFQEQIEGGERLDLGGIFSPLPPYYSELLELVTRIMRRPTHPTPMLRHLQAAAWGSLVARAPLDRLLLDSDPVTTKLLNDVARFLVGAAGIDNEFRIAFAALLDPTSLARSTEAPAAPGNQSSDRRARADRRATDPSDVAEADGVEREGKRRETRSQIPEGQESLPVEGPSAR